MPRREVSIIMYHYVREIGRSRYPDIKGLEVEDFRQQLRYIQRHYNVVRMEDLIAARAGTADLPPNALLLTFDDGYSDHFEFVFPLLDALGLQGSFFPPAQAILERRVLDVNKIHFILASTPEKKRLVDHILAEISANRDAYGLEEPRRYYDRASQESDRHDTPDVVFIKRALQRDLPEDLRGRLIGALFARHVTADEGAFSGELYMSLEQIRCMRRHGMHVGSHGFNHFWLNTLPPASQEAEISRSVEFLREVGCDLSRWTMCYPYGACNDSLKGIVRERGGVIGLGTVPGIADLDRDDPLVLPRLDATDLPKDGAAPANDWTRRAQRPASGTSAGSLR